jgi:hypothetical protein
MSSDTGLTSENTLLDESSTPYLQIRSTEARLEPGRLQMAFERLYRTSEDADTAVECLLASTDAGIEYLFGLGPDTARIEPVLRSGLPDEYEPVEAM